MSTNDTPGSRPLMPRRGFLRAGAGLAAGAALSRSSLGYSLPSGARVLGLGPGSAVGALGRSLVLVQLSGGNDGLSTIVPYADDVLGQSRTATRHDPAKLLRIDDYRAFNPKLAGIRAEYDEGRVAIVEGAGYPDPVRSHFKSLEVWHTGRRGGRSTGDGWIGRLAASSWKEGGAADAVLHLGGRAPYSLYSTTHPPLALVSPTGYRWFGDEAVYSLGGSAICEHEPDSMEGAAGSGRHAGRDRALASLRKTLDDASESSQRVRAAVAAYASEVEYPRNSLAASLRDVAALLAGGVGTRIFSVQAGAYDTHTNQLAQHDRNLGSLDGSLAAFLKDIQGSEAGRRAIVVVFSEFGRRVAENGSKGHDHGKAGPVLVLGQPVRGGLYGAHPSMTELDDGDLAFTTDFRRVYATLLDRWFEVPSKEILGADYEGLGFLG